MTDFTGKITQDFWAVDCWRLTSIEDGRDRCVSLIYEKDNESFRVPISNELLHGINHKDKSGIFRDALLGHIRQQQRKYGGKT